MYKNNHNMFKSPKYQCTSCNTCWQTKQTYELHISMCKIIHTANREKAIDNDYKQLTLPTKEEMFHYILHLTNKYEKLEEKVNKIHKITTSLRRKNIDEYLSTLKPPKINYFEWFKKIEITYQHLDYLFENDLKSCIKYILEGVMKERDEIPLYAFSQKPNTLYLYDNTVWRAMTTDEMNKFVSIISHRISKKYTAWVSENKDLEGYEEKQMIYLCKANGLNCSFENRVLDIKKWIFSKVHISLKQVDF